MTESLNTNKEKSLQDKFLENIYAELEGVAEENKKRRFKSILKEYGIEWKDEYDTMWVTEHEPEVSDQAQIQKEEKPKSLKRLGKYALAGVAGVASMVTLNLKQSENKNGEANKEEDRVEIKTETKPEPQKENTVAYEPRLKIEIYNSLPENGKKVYAYFANFNPTPGRGYMMLDKDSATQYVFNDKNELVAKITAGYGKEMGDEHNTSYKENTGRTTTPAGAYILSNASTESDVKKYGEMQYSLFGVSVLGEKETLGLHQTYPKQLEFRTSLLNTPSKEDNKFSDGCVNVPLEEFTKNIKPYFQGDGGEIMIILPDAKSREVGTEFNIELLVKKSLEMIVEMADRQEKALRNKLAIVRTTEEYTATKAKIDELMIRRARAMKILEGK